MQLIHPGYRLIAIAIGGLSLATSASALSITYNMTGITWVNDTMSGLPMVETHVTTGQFVFNCNAGDFANGSETILSLDSPFHPFSPAFITQVGSTGLTITDPGNTQNLTYDVAMNFSLSPSGGTITGGTYDITGVNAFFQGEFLGHITAGVITPVPEPTTLGALAMGALLLRWRRR